LGDARKERNMTNKARHIRINHSDDKVTCFRIDYEQGSPTFIRIENFGAGNVDIYARTNADVDREGNPIYGIRTKGRSFAPGAPGCDMPIPGAPWPKP
jgi:hypothetical protein